MGGSLDELKVLERVVCSHVITMVDNEAIRHYLAGVSSVHEVVLEDAPAGHVPRPGVLSGRRNEPVGGCHSPRYSVRTVVQERSPN
jgi:hypothetical protein